MPLEQNALEELKALIGGDHDALAELIESFLTDGDELIDASRTACQDHDTELLRRSAHTLKSGAADFGAPELSRLSAALEAECKNGWPQTATDQVEAIAGEYEQSKKSLTEYLSNTG